jgi:hypothetical protein
MLGKLRHRFVDEARNFYKHASMWLAGLVAAIAPFILQSPEIILTITQQLPPELKQWLPLWLGPVIFGFLFIVRYWRQKKPPCDGE